MDDLVLPIIDGPKESYDPEKLDKLRSLRITTEEQEDVNDEELVRINKNKAAWVSFWRQNLNLYAHYKLGINLFPYQHYKLFMMSDSTDFTDISTRGTSKSWTAMVFAVCMCMLYPNIRGAVGAVILQQAVDNADTTLIKELIQTQSDYLHYLWDEKWIQRTRSERGPLITFGNGGQIDFFPVIDSSRKNKNINQTKRRTFCGWKKMEFRRRTIFS